MFGSSMKLAAGCFSLVLAVVAIASGAVAQESADTATFKPAPTDFWRASAVMDVEAAYRLLKDNHPGAVPAVGDPGFLETLEKAHALAAERAGRTQSFEAYSATLAAFANSFGDKHVRARPLYLEARPDWAGVIMSKRGDHWIVADEEAIRPEESLKDAALISCDGRTPEDLGKEILGGFRVDWSVEAQQEQAAPWLLVSERNPYAPRPKVCVFDKAGERRSVTLQWRSIRRDTLTPRLQAAIGVGAAGMGLRRAGDGYWIALQTLDDPAAGVVETVRAQAVPMRAAPFVIIDLRGNGGGSSLFGRQIAAMLMGKAHVDAILGGEDDPCGGAWRLSEGNLRQMDYYREALGPTRGPEFIATIDKLRAQARAAKAAGQEFSAPLACPQAEHTGATAPSTFAGRLYLVTDGYCFSSCLTVVDDLRHLGAIQLGRTTDANTHYTEVRDAPMPSGLATVSTMMAVSTSDPLRFGPFEPQEVFQGDIADTRAVEAWATGIAQRR